MSKLKEIVSRFNNIMDIITIQDDSTVFSKESVKQILNNVMYGIHEVKEAAEWKSCTYYFPELSHGNLPKSYEVLIQYEYEKEDTNGNLIFRKSYCRGYFNYSDGFWYNSETNLKIDNPEYWQEINLI